MNKIQETIRQRNNNFLADKLLSLMDDAPSEEVISQWTYKEYEEVNLWEVSGIKDEMPQVLRDFVSKSRE